MTVRFACRGRRWLAAGLLATLAPIASAQVGQIGNALGILNNLMNRPAGETPSPAALLPGNLQKAGEIAQSLSKALEDIDEPREIDIGRQLAAVLLGSKPLDPDMALQRYVNRLGRWLSLQSSRPQLPWSFAVLDDPGFNAFAAPGGYVFVTRGLVDRVDEAGLAGILAHEIVHVTERHHLKAIRVQGGTTALTQALATQVRGPIATAVSPQLLSLGRNLYTRGLDRDDEFDADRLGVSIAARAGFDPYGLASVLEQLRVAAPDNPLFSLSLATHPAPQQRLDSLDEAMGRKLDALSGKPVVPVSRRVQASR